MSTNIPVFLSSDNNYALFVATTIASICDNTESFVEFYVLDGGITKENQEKILDLKKQFNNFSIEFIKVDINTVFKDVDYTNDCKYVTISTYNRILIPNIKPDLKKVIYLDVDIIANCDIKELYQTNMQNYAIAAVPDNGQSLEYINSLKRNMSIDINHSYFNAGVLLIDIEKWIKNNITENLIELTKKYETILKMADQDVLNKYFENNYCLLDIKYNVMSSSNEVFLRHFAGLIKPWQADFYFDTTTKKPILLKDCELFWKYAKMTCFYDKLRENKEKFLNSNVLYKRFNKIILENGAK